MSYYTRTNCFVLAATKTIGCADGHAGDADADVTVDPGVYQISWGGPAVLNIITPCATSAAFTNIMTFESQGSIEILIDPDELFLSSDVDLLFIRRPEGEYLRLIRSSTGGITNEPVNYSDIRLPRYGAPAGVTSGR